MTNDKNALRQICRTMKTKTLPFHFPPQMLVQDSLPFSHFLYRQFVIEGQRDFVHQKSEYQQAMPKKATKHEVITMLRMGVLGITFITGTFIYGYNSYKKRPFEERDSHLGMHLIHLKFQQERYEIKKRKQRRKEIAEEYVRETEELKKQKLKQAEEML